MKRLALLFLLALPLSAQEIHFDSSTAAQPQSARPQHVLLLTDNFNVDAGKSEEIDLRFRVGQGLHINSHAPKDELML
ncbi:MAG: hypothetical protein PW735_00005, partial [Acidobacteriaceae bacterium]|nr:hypothetical protein [Acidobacteriaceae bacterium]